MKVFSNRFLKRIGAEERYKILQELQMKEEINHPFLSSPKLFTRCYRALLEKCGEILFALIVAAVAVICNYYILVKFLHFEF
jgi:hypothetical protein